MRNQIRVVLATLLMCTVAFVSAPAAVGAEPATAAVVAPAAQPAPVGLTDQDLAQFEAREAQAQELREFRGGDADAVVAWTALGVAGAALVLALIAL